MKKVLAKTLESGGSGLAQASVSGRKKLMRKDEDRRLPRFAVSAEPLV